MAFFLLKGVSELSSRRENHAASELMRRVKANRRVSFLEYNLKAAAHRKFETYEPEVSRIYCVGWSKYLCTGASHQGPVQFGEVGAACKRVQNVDWDLRLKKISGETIRIITLIEVKAVEGTIIS